MKVEVKTITPAIAEKILTRHNNRIANGEFRQRRVSQARVDQYALEMKRGHWVVNSSGISFDENGDVINGQHRLWAVVKSGTTIESLWITELPVTVKTNGLDVRTIDTEDAGVNRSVHHQLSMDGVSYASIMASSARIIGFVCGSSKVRLSVNQTREVLALYGTAISKTLEVMRHDSKVTRGYVVGVLAMYRQIDAGKSEDFASSYVDMVDLNNGSPVLTLLKHFRNNRASLSQLNATKIAALACYHHEQNGKINGLRISTIGTDWLCEGQKSKVAKVREIIGSSMSIE